MLKKNIMGRMIKINLNNKQIQLGAFVAITAISLKYLGQSTKKNLAIICVVGLAWMVVNELRNRKFNNAILLILVGLPLSISLMGILFNNMLIMFIAGGVFFISLIIITIKGIKYDNTKN